MIKLINILREGKQVGDIYHYTSINGDAIINILKSGKLRPSPARMEKKGYISFSRDRSLNYTLGSSKTQVRITIDGDKLSNKYKITPYSQLKPETAYDKKNWVAPFSRSTQDSESELVIPAKKYGGSIDILPYIKKIDIVDLGWPEHTLPGRNLIDAIKKVKKLCEQHNIPFEVHEEYNSDIPWSPSKYTKPKK
jgi:hypothetical protein